MSGSDADKLNVDSIIQRLLEGETNVRAVSGLFTDWLEILSACRLFFSLVTCTAFSFAVRGNRPGKNVQLSEGEIRGLCLKSREIFLSQPILLELEAPLKICGKLASIG